MWAQEPMREQKLTIPPLPLVLRVQLLSVFPTITIANNPPPAMTICYSGIPSMKRMVQLPPIILLMDAMPLSKTWHRPTVLAEKLVRVLTLPHRTRKHPVTPVDSIWIWVPGLSVVPIQYPPG